LNRTTISVDASERLGDKTSGLIESSLGYENSLQQLQSLQTLASDDLNALNTFAQLNAKAGSVIQQELKSRPTH